MKSFLLLTLLGIVAAAAAIFFQNCGSVDFEKIDKASTVQGLKALDSDLLASAHVKIRKANLNASDFLYLMDSVEKFAQIEMDKKQDAENEINKEPLTQEELAEQKFEYLRRITTALSAFLTFVKEIPRLTPDQETSLDSAIDLLDAMQSPRQDDEFLKAILILIRLKNTIVVLPGITTVANSCNDEALKMTCRSVQLINSMMEALRVARPSQNESLEHLKMSLISMMTFLINGRNLTSLPVNAELCVKVPTCKDLIVQSQTALTIPKLEDLESIELRFTLPKVLDEDGKIDLQNLNLESHSNDTSDKVPTEE